MDIFEYYIVINDYILLSIGGEARIDRVLACTGKPACAFMPFILVRSSAGWYSTPPPTLRLDDIQSRDYAYDFKDYA